MTPGSTGIEFVGTVRLDGPRGPVEVAGAGDVLTIRLREARQLGALASLGRALRRHAPSWWTTATRDGRGPAVGFDLIVGSRRVATWRTARRPLGWPGRWRPDVRGLLGLR